MDRRCRNDTPAAHPDIQFLKTQEESVLLHILTKRVVTTRRSNSRTNFTASAAVRSRRKNRAPDATTRIIARALANSPRQIANLPPSRRDASGTGLSHFAAHPARYFDVGIAEEHARYSWRAGDARPDAIPHHLLHVLPARRHGVHDMASRC
jgi:deoxyxylulose-5-phosphate synthase